MNVQPCPPSGKPDIEPAPPHDRVPRQDWRMMAEAKEFVSKGRLDSLTDGVFAFAMTLLYHRIGTHEGLDTS